MSERYGANATIENRQKEAAKTTAEFVVGSPFRSGARDAVEAAYTDPLSGTPGNESKKAKEVVAKTLQDIYPLERQEAKKPRGLASRGLGKLATNQLVKGGVAATGLTIGAMLDWRYGHGVAGAASAAMMAAGGAAAYGYHKLEVLMGGLYGKKSPKLVEKGETIKDVTRGDLFERAKDDALSRIRRSRASKAIAVAALAFPATVGAVGAGVLKPEAAPAPVTHEVSGEELIQGAVVDKNCDTLQQVAEQLYPMDPNDGGQLEIYRTLPDGGAETYIVDVAPGSKAALSTEIDEFMVELDCK